MLGVVKRIIEQKGYGFILGEDRREYFFHADDLLNTEFSLIAHEIESNRPVRVDYEPTASAKGMRASNIKLLIDV
jgi:cold shock CspA family protein